MLMFSSVDAFFTDFLARGFLGSDEPNINRLSAYFRVTNDAHVTRQYDLDISLKDTIRDCNILKIKHVNQQHEHLIAIQLVPYACMHVAYVFLR